MFRCSVQRVCSTVRGIMFGATDSVCVGCVVADVGNAEILGAPTHVCPQGLEMKFLNILQKFRPRKNRVSISDSCESKFRSVVVAFVCPVFRPVVSGVEHVLIRENFCRIECVREAMSNWGSASGRRTKADMLRTRTEFFFVRLGGSDFVLQIFPQRGVRRHELRHLLLQRVLWRIVFGR